MQTYDAGSRMNQEPFPSPAPSAGTIIRAMRAEDLDAVRRLWSVCEGVGIDAEESVEMLTKYLARNPEISSVAVGASGEMCGAVLGGHDGRRGYMHHLGVEPAQRGLGLGRALVARTVAQMARHGLAKAAIVVYSHNEAGFRFWERLGWKRRRDLSVMRVALEPR